MKRDANRLCIPTPVARKDCLECLLCGTGRMYIHTYTARGEIEECGQEGIGSRVFPVPATAVV